MTKIKPNKTNLHFKVSSTVTEDITFTGGSGQYVNISVNEQDTMKLGSYNITYAVAPDHNKISFTGSPETKSNVIGFHVNVTDSQSNTISIHMTFVIEDVGDNILEKNLFKLREGMVIPVAEKLNVKNAGAGKVEFSVSANSKEAIKNIGLNISKDGLITGVPQYITAYTNRDKQVSGEGQTTTFDIDVVANGVTHTAPLSIYIYKKPEVRIQYPNGYSNTALGTLHLADAHIYTKEISCVINYVTDVKSLRLKHSDEGRFNLLPDPKNKHGFILKDKFTSTDLTKSVKYKVGQTPSLIISFLDENGIVVEVPMTIHMLAHNKIGIKQPNKDKESIKLTGNNILAPEQKYNATIKLTGGIPPYIVDFAMLNGQLPVGLTASFISDDEILITGTLQNRYDNIATKKIELTVKDVYDDSQKNARETITIITKIKPPITDITSFKVAELNVPPDNKGGNPKHKVSLLPGLGFDDAKSHEFIKITKSNYPDYPAINHCDIMADPDDDTYTTQEIREGTSIHDILKKSNYKEKGLRLLSKDSNKVIMEVLTRHYEVETANSPTIYISTYGNVDDDKINMKYTLTNKYGTSVPKSIGVSFKQPQPQLKQHIDVRSDDSVDRIAKVNILHEAQGAPFDLVAISQESIDRLQKTKIAYTLTSNGDIAFTPDKNITEVPNFPVKVIAVKGIYAALTTLNLTVSKNK